MSKYSTQKDWAEHFYINQAYRAAQEIRWLDRRLPAQKLRILQDASRWLSEALERAEAHETEAEHAEEA